MTSRELVCAALNRANPARVPRDLWTLPWAQARYPEAIAALQRDFTWDFSSPDPQLNAQADVSAVTHGKDARQDEAAVSGDPYAVGEYRDAWGCTFVNIHGGVIGEVKEPLIRADDWSDACDVHIPEEWLRFEPGCINAQCTGEKFMLTPVTPRPFERLQFLRTSPLLYMDLMDPPPKMLDFLAQMHDFYCRLLTRYAQTDIDALFFMDDWGAQNNLLIPPALWEKLFLPLYRDYIDIAHRHGKKAFMHSDGNTLKILPQLIDAGLDAINCQIFCMGVKNLAPFRGKITFWGEMDRQHLLPAGSPQDVEQAVDAVYEALWADGGVIAQCEFGPGARPENVRRVYERFAEKGRLA
ncbi:MAG: uroporphyrinogen decarboxylase family protein [Eubacteriales bacterium]|nr:uroporphyrinogen decarboxylase family protein [Eubacteriales bacterium]